MGSQTKGVLPRHFVVALSTEEQEKKKTGAEIAPQIAVNAGKAAIGASLKPISVLNKVLCILLVVVLVTSCFVVLGVLNPVRAYGSTDTATIDAQVSADKNTTSVDLGNLSEADSIQNIAIKGLSVGGWIKSYGGSGRDQFASVIQVANGDFIAVGYSYSNDRDLAENKGSTDFIIARFDSDGNKLWIKNYGGSSYDYLYAVTQTSDGNFVAIGSSGSNDGDFSDNIISSVAFIIKFDQDGNKIWIKYCGNGFNGDYSITPMLNGSFVTSSSGIQKFDSNGDEIWTNSITGIVRLDSVIQTSSGDFVAVGSGSLAFSNDIIIAKLDENGNTAWVKGYGGSGYDYLESVIEAPDGGLVAVGASDSNDGDFSGDYKFREDFVIAKFDADGNKLWIKAYGGSDLDALESVVLTSDDTFVAVGSSRSNDGDLLGNKGLADFVIAEFDADGNKLWIKNYGGPGIDVLESVELTLDGGFVAVGASDSTGGDVYGKGGNIEFILAKFDFVGGISKDVTAKTFAGKSRQDTAAQVALEAYSGGAAGVIIANGEGQGKTGKFPDALAASSLAGLLDYPILLTAPDSLPSYTAEALKKLNPQKIIILGDNNSINSKVVAALKTNNPAAGEPIRLKGANRIDTAVAIYNYGVANGNWAKTAIFADASNFPDALAIAPLAGNKHFPIFLVQGNSLSKSVTDVFTKANFTDAIIVGSSKSVSTTIENQIKQILGKDPIRLQGTNRYATAKAIAAYSIQQGLSYNNAAIATGENFPDALTGGPLLAKRGSVVLLATDTDTSTLDLLKGNTSISKIHILGGNTSVGPKVRNTVEDRLGWARGTIG